MRPIISLLALGFFAFAFVSFAKYSDGVVLFTGFGYQVEFTLTVFIILQIALIIFLHISLKILSFVLSSKRNLLAYFKSRQEQKEISRLRIAITNLVAGETSTLYQEAKKYIREDNKVSKEMLLLAAKAAHIEGKYSDRDRYIAQLEESDANDIYLTKALMLIDEGRHHDALAALQKLQKRSVGSVRVELEALRIGRNWGQILPLIKVARKLNAMDDDDCHRIELEAIEGRLANLDISLLEVEQVSKYASKRIRREPSFVLLMSQALWSRGEVISAQKMVEEYLNSAWDDALVKHYVLISETKNLLALEAVEGWLIKQPRNPTLLMALGVMCRDQELWGKSESYFRASDALDASAEVAYELSKLYKIMNRMEESRAQLELFAVRQVVNF
jgi:HemY protein